MEARKSFKEKSSIPAVQIMGGDHTWYIPPKTANDAESVFKSAVEEVKQASGEPRRKNVFISFAMEDQGPVGLMRHQAKSPDFDLDFRDYSVKEPIEEKWKSAVRERIAQTSATIVVISENSAKSDAVNWEIEESYRQGKKVIGVRLHNDRDDPLPPALAAHNARIINWNGKEINDALQEP
jgi:hypothetical protein